MRLIIINGPNLGMLGIREPKTYGIQTLGDLNSKIVIESQKKGITVDFFQSDSEGEIIKKIHSCRNLYDGIIINAGALTHYSYALRDAIPIAGIPVVEVHISNIYSREEFRQKSVISSVCKGVISGFGVASYFMALDYFARENA